MNEPYNPVVALLAHNPKKLQWSHTNLHECSQQICNSPKLEIIQMSFRLNYDTPCYGILSSNKKNQTIDRWNNLDIPQENYTKWKNQSQKDTAWFHLYDICEIV